MRMISSMLLFFDSSSCFQRKGVETDTFYYQIFLTFFDPSRKAVIGETYESALFPTRMVETNMCNATADQFLFFHFRTHEQLALIAEVVLVGLDLSLLLRFSMNLF